MPQFLLKRFNCLEMYVLLDRINLEINYSNNRLKCLKHLSFIWRNVGLNLSQLQSISVSCRLFWYKNTFGQNFTKATFIYYGCINLNLTNVIPAEYKILRKFEAIIFNIKYYMEIRSVYLIRFGT